MNILHIISGDGGGISTYVKTLISRGSRNYHFSVLSFTEYSEDFKKIANEFESNIYTMPRPRNNGMFKFLKFVNEVFRENRYDLIECHITGVHALVFKFLAQKNNNKNFIIHVHQTSLVYGREMTAIEKLIYYANPIINRIISPLRVGCGIDAVKYGFGQFDETKTHIIYNSVNVNKYYANYSLKKNDDKVIIGHIGRHTAQKNLEFIIGFAKYLKKIHSRFKFEIRLFGNGERTEWLVDEVQKNNLGDLIIIMGRVDNIEEFYPELDVTILPSFTEGLPTVTIESQATGTPSVLSTTITKEVDLGLGLLTFLPIDRTYSNYESWLETIIIYKNSDLVEVDEIKQKMEEKKFTEEQMINSFNELVNYTTRIEVQSDRKIERK